ncbi:MAG: C-GCAxxG-C-C family protein [Eubacteriaceae bacterium]|nr:C-GCAxxG-C-C family protein [Eubacteriaceae bacterium]
MKIKMTEEKALKSFGGGIDCSQVVFGATAEQLGLDEKTARKISAAFGGGMWRGETCGCVTGALMAIGLKYGQSEIGESKTKEKMLAKKAEFERIFAEKNGDLICRKILKYDLSKPEEMKKIQEEKLLETLCPKLACSACRILEKILEEK